MIPEKILKEKSYVTDNGKYIKIDLTNKENLDDYIYTRQKYQTLEELKLFWAGCQELFGICLLGLGIIGWIFILGLFIN